MRRKIAVCFVTLIVVLLPSAIPSAAQCVKAPRRPGMRPGPMPDPDSLRHQERINSSLLMESPRPPAGAVSARELLIPSKAKKEFERGNKAYLTKDFKTAAEHWQKAIQIDADFLEARNNLGTSYLMMGKYEKALPEFEKAIALDPKKVGPYINLSLTLALLDRHQDSEMAARHALQIEPNDGVSRCLLGQALVAQRQSTQETVDSLCKCQDNAPESPLWIVQVLALRGEREKATAELRDYLRVATGPERQTAQCWLAMLTDADASGACDAAQKNALTKVDFEETYEC